MNSASFGSTSSLEFECLLSAHNAAWDHLNEINRAFGPQSERFKPALRAAELSTLNIAIVRAKSMADVFAKVHAFRQLLQAKQSGPEYKLVPSILCEAIVSDLMTLEAEGAIYPFTVAEVKAASKRGVEGTSSVGY